MPTSLVSEKSTNKTKKIGKKTFHEALTDKQNAVHDFRQALGRSNKDLEQRFYQNEDVEKLVRQRAQIVDDAILVAWNHLANNLTKNAALIAVGGYGRGELHPHSDIDLMILLDDIENKKNIDKIISQFLTFLWDIGLEVGHSVRSLQDCETQARLDVTVLTTMMEARLLRGPQKLFEELGGKIDTARMWNSDEFFKAKLDEQIARHNRYDNTPYNLEPNIKGSPGGLRDIQMISWLVRRHLGVTHLDELVGKNLLTPGQLRILSSGKNFLWKIRFCLHLLTGRREDRLLFDYQIKVAKLLGYEDASYTLAVEQLMQRYYRTVMELSRLNEMLWQLLEEVIFLNTDAVVAPMGKNFNARNGYLEAANEKIFIKDPSALLEIFLLLEKN
ncbi:MAG: nucleotidyltransferase domain-containing protein, partial [Pseudomonadota bacterium]|nr:nucleotidyltransferase domain-containing protein [Pseudomonadota bacterium]